VKLVVALGGHALAPPGGGPVAHQQLAVARAVAAIASLAREHELVVTHGNGPQIGWLAKTAQAAGETPGLDVLGAESEGMLGYWLEQELRAALPGREVAALLTQVEVDARDVAFAQPSKPIGPLVSARELESLRAAGVPVAPDRDGVRRVVASPAPLRVLELRCIELLLAARVVVICGGGGGIPVVRDAHGRLHGAAAVVDKDRSAELLAHSLAADGLLLLTDVPAVYADWPERAEPIRRIRGAELARRRFAPGTMGPKVEAACRFVRVPGRRAWIGALEDASALVRGGAGTEVIGEDAAEAERRTSEAPAQLTGGAPAANVRAAPARRGGGRS
jgi:carbamate kinase